MKLPKLTRSRFLVLWGAGVALCFLISWRMIFDAGNSVQNRQYPHSEKKLSNDVLEPDLNWNEGLRNGHELINDIPAVPPSSVLDITETDKIAHSQNAKGSVQLNVDRNRDRNRFPVDKSNDELLPFPVVDDAKTEGKMANSPEFEFSFLLVPHPEMKDDSKYFSQADAKPSVQVEHFQDVSEEINSYVSSQDGESDQVAMVTAKSVKTGLFDGEKPRLRLPNVAPDDTGSSEFDKIREDGSLFLPRIAHGVNKEVATLTAKSVETDLLDGENIAHLPQNFYPDNQESNKFGTFDQQRNHLFPPVLPHTEKKHEVVIDTGKLHVEQTPSDTHTGESNKVAIEQAKAVQPRFLPKETHPSIPSLHHDKSNKMSSDTSSLADTNNSPGNAKQTVPANDSDLRGTTVNQPLRNHTDHRLSQDGVLHKNTIVNSKPVMQQGEGVPGRVELKHPQQSALSEVVAVQRNSDTRKDIPSENETEAEFLQRMVVVQEQRHALIQHQCQSSYNLTLLDFRQDRQKILSWKKYFEHAYANDDHRFIICRVLKVGSLSWRKVMRSLHTKGSLAFRRSQNKGDYPMMEYDDATFMSKLEKYKKVLFVREPFARFLSAYRDKYVELRHFPYYKPIGTSIIKKYRHNSTQSEIASGRPTFEEFTRWVITEEVPEGDFHWRPLFNWYHPCEISYDYIGKLETAADDAKYIFKKIGIDKLEMYPSTETHHKFSSSAEVLKEFYSQLSPELLPKLIERYREEFELFNYPIPKKMSDIWT